MEHEFRNWRHLIWAIPAMVIATVLTIGRVTVVSRIIQTAPAVEDSDAKQT